MTGNVMIIANAEIRERELSVPEGHKHLRGCLRLQNGEELVLQEATIANLVRAYVMVKTDPQRQWIKLTGFALAEDERKAGFAEWQLLEREP